LSIAAKPARDASACLAWRRSTPALPSGLRARIVLA
jgi:hypothetical protein